MNPSPELNRRKYVFDTSALVILFEKCNLADALLKFSQKNDLLVPIKVMEEFFAFNNAQTAISSFQKIFIPIKVDLATEILPYFNFDSSAGETWVISHAIKNPACCCVIDEEFGRNICRIFSVNVTGAIGIIAEMKKMEILSKEDLLRIRNAIRNSRFYLSKKLCDELDRICLT